MARLTLAGVILLNALSILGGTSFSGQGKFPGSTAIAMHLPALDDSMVWEFVHPQNGKTVNFRPNGRITANNSDLLAQGTIF